MAVGFVDFCPEPVCCCVENVGMISVIGLGIVGISDGFEEGVVPSATSDTDVLDDFTGAIGLGISTPKFAKTTAHSAQQKIKQAAEAII